MKNKKKYNSSNSKFLGKQIFNRPKTGNFSQKKKLLKTNNNIINYNNGNNNQKKNFFKFNSTGNEKKIKENIIPYINNSKINNFNLNSDNLKQIMSLSEKKHMFKISKGNAQLLNNFKQNFEHPIKVKSLKGENNNEFNFFSKNMNNNIFLENKNNLLVKSHDLSKTKLKLKLKKEDEDEDEFKLKNVFGIPKRNYDNLEKEILLEIKQRDLIEELNILKKDLNEKIKIIEKLKKENEELKEKELTIDKFEKLLKEKENEISSLIKKYKDLEEKYNSNEKNHQVKRKTFRLKTNNKKEQKKEKNKEKIKIKKKKLSYEEVELLKKQNKKFIYIDSKINILHFYLYSYVIGRRRTRKNKFN